MNTLVNSIATKPIKKMNVTDDALVVSTLLTAMNDIDNRLQDMTLDVADVHELDDIIQLMKTIISRFGGTVSNSDAASSFTLRFSPATSEEQANGYTIKLMSHPIIVPGKSSYQIDII